jgi:hypothetical protein
MKNKKRLWLLLPVLLAFWIAFDLLVPHKSSLRNFNAAAVGRLDSDMWRSYYGRERVKLFWQLSKLMRKQFRAPFWRSFPMAYLAAKAAVVFQDGRSREQYAAALPFLEKYFTQINALSDQPFDVISVAKNELEWWIIRREPQHTTADWEQVLSDVSSEMYQVPRERFTDYARLRVEAMVLRDSLGERITEADWVKITGLLEESWGALHEAVN